MHLVELKDHLLEFITDVETGNISYPSNIVTNMDSILLDWLDKVENGLDDMPFAERKSFVNITFPSYLQGVESALNCNSRLIISLTCDNLFQLHPKPRIAQ